MAAVDRRMGLVRRGGTPAAPKPINLPSQKLENNSLFPDVELVPRGTCCWGGARRATATNIPSKETTDSVPLHSESNGAVDNGTVLPNDLAPSDDVQRAPSEDVQSSSNLPLPAAESQRSPTLSTSETNDAKVDSRSSAASDAGSLAAGSVAPASSAESDASSLASPVIFNETGDSVAKVELQEHNEGAPVDCCEEPDNLPNLESKQGTHFSNESLPGLQDFGYFEGVYNSHNAFFSPGMPYSNGSGMAFGPGSHLDPSQHYSFLGVPYYDSAKDKEIVVITMVGNPGIHGNYPPHPGFSDQYGRHMVCGNFPLQFGHFDHFAMPGQNMHGRQHSSAEMKPMCSGEQGDFVCYDQGYQKEDWLNGSAMGNVQRGNGTYVLSPFSMCKSGYVPKRGGRQKPFNNRNKRAALKEVSSAALKPERRVTLLTKVSQHEVIISSFQQRDEAVEHGQVTGFSDAPFSENFMESACAPPCETTIVSAREVVNTEKSPAEISVSELSPTPESLLASEAQEEMSVCHQDTAATSFLGAAHQVRVAPDRIPSEVTVKKAKPTSEARWVTFNHDGLGTNVMELPLAASLKDLTKPATLGEQENEHGNGKEIPSTRTAGLLPHERENASTSRFQDKKSTKKWKRKEFVSVANMGQEHFNSKTQEAAVEDKRALSPLPSDKTPAGPDSSPDATADRKAMLQCNASLDSGLSAALSAASGEKLDAAGSIDCAGPDSVSKAKKMKKSFKPISNNVALEKVQTSSPVQDREFSNKVALSFLPVLEDQGSNLKTDSCGVRKEWRPKLCASGHGKSTTKVPCHQASKHAIPTNISKTQESEPCSADIHGTPKHTLKVSIGDDCVEKSKLRQQDDSHDVLSLMVDRQESAKNMSSNRVIAFDSNKSTENRGKVECNSKTLPLRCGTMEQTDVCQQEPLASKPGQSKCTCGGNRPMNDETSNVTKVGSRSTEAKGLAHLDSKVSKAPKPCNFWCRAHCCQSVPSLHTEEKSEGMEDFLCPCQNNCGHSMQAQNGKPKDLIKAVNQCSKAAPKLLRQLSVQEYQEPKQRLVKNLPHQNAGPGHFRKNYQHTGSVTRSLPSFGIDSMKQDCYVASCVERRGGVPLQNSWNERFGWNHSHIQEEQPMYRWQKQQVWKSKATSGQVQQTSAVTHSSVSKPHEECCTVSEGKRETEKKQQISALEGTVRVSWKPKKSSPVQVFKEKSKQAGQVIPPSPAPPVCVSRKPQKGLSRQVSKEKSKEAGQDISPSLASCMIRAQGECVVMESSHTATMPSPWGEKQQVEKQAAQVSLPQEKETSKGCPFADPSFAPSSPSCENGQQAGKIGQQGTSSEYQKASDDLPAFVSSFSCGNWHDMTEADDRESLKPALQMKMRLEGYSVVTSSGGNTSSTRVNGQQAGNAGKQSCKSALEMKQSAPVMKQSAPVKKVRSSVERAVFGIASQPVSAVAMSLKVEDTPPMRKPHHNYTSWRPKTVSGKMDVKLALSKEVNENDPSASTHVEGAVNKGGTMVLPANKFATSNDLHVWKNNGRHPVRASYGLPYRRKDYLHLHAPLQHQGKLLTDGAYAPAIPAAKEKKLSSPMKQTHIWHWEHPVSTLKFSQQHHVYAVKQGHCMSHQHSAVGNRKPFSTKSNLPQDDNKKTAVHYQQQPISRVCAPMELSYCRSSSANSKFSCDDNKRAVRHQPSLLHASKHTEHFKVKESSYAQGISRVEKSRSDLKPARHGQLNNGRKFTDFDSDKRGWVVKTESRSGPHHLPASVKVGFVGPGGLFTG